MVSGYSMRWAMSAGVLLLGLLVGQAAGAKGDWVGAEVCAGCHEPESKAWKMGPHATASASLGRRAGDGRCEGCHSTGHAPAGRSAFPNVQCEACHGPGRYYASEDVMRDPILARALGLRDLGTTAALQSACLTCHEASTSLAPFDAVKAWAKIGHQSR